MFHLVLILLAVWVVLMLVLAAWTLFFQGYLYTEPVTDLYWRAPAAGTALMVVLCLWVVLDYRAPGRYRGPTEFSPVEHREPYEELRVVTRGRKEPEVYKLRRSARGGWEYRRDGRQLPSRPERVLVREGDQTYTFEPERDAAGNFKVRTPPWYSLSRQSEPLRYQDERGLVMLEGQFGQVSTFRTGALVLHLSLNLLHLAAWFLCVWLLLGFQWPHALGQAFVFWGVTTLFVLPPLLTRAEEVARQRAAPAPQAAAPAGLRSTRGCA